jgi:hypothetical protein
MRQGHGTTATLIALANMPADQMISGLAKDQCLGVKQVLTLKADWTKSMMAPKSSHAYSLPSFCICKEGFQLTGDDPGVAVMSVGRGGLFSVFLLT